MNILPLTSNILESLAQCESLYSVWKLLDAKEADIRRLLNSSGYNVPNSNFLLRYEAQEYMKSAFCNEWQFIVDLVTIKYSLSGDWIPYENQPNYYGTLKREIFAIRSRVIKSVSHEIAAARMATVHNELKQALLVDEDVDIICRFNPFEEFFIVMLDVKIPLDTPKLIRRRIEKQNREAQRLGIGENTWIVSYGFDTQNIRNLIREDSYQHKKLISLSKQLVLPY